jgi:membrane-bound metal-dependent hydrolase YbcI (DUF457 family)
MPNGIIHKTTGAILGPITYKLIHNNLPLTEEIELLELLFSFSIGISSAKLPDMIEPAINPNHRSFFHSTTFAGISTIVGIHAWKDLKEKINTKEIKSINGFGQHEFIDIGLIIICASVLLHLTLDAFTPKGLPII